MGYQTAGTSNVTPNNVLTQIQHLRRRALALTHSRADAEDLLQDTLERALRALPHCRPGSNVGAWLKALMNHRFIDEWRSRKRTRPLEAISNLAAPVPEPPPAWLEITDSEIKAGINRLPAASAALLRLRYCRHLSYIEIARRLGTSLDTVGTRLLRARRRLQKVLSARHLQPCFCAALTPIAPANATHGPQRSPH